MPTEVAEFIADLVKSRPGPDESISEGYEHLNLLKATLKQTFTGSESDPWNTELTVGPRALNALDETLGLSSFVTVSGDQDITGEKTFTKAVEAPGHNINGENGVGWYNGLTILGNSARGTYLASSGKNGLLSSYPGGQGYVLHHENFLELMLNTLHPVGSVFLSINNVNPASRFPGTTWVRIAQGKFLVGEGTGRDGAGLDKYFDVRNNNGWYKVSLRHQHIPDGFAASPNNEVSLMAPGVNQGDGEPFNVQPPGYGVYVWERTK